MPTLLEGIFVLLGLVYGFGVLILLVGFALYRSPKQKLNLTVSVIVAARNEENSIKACLESLARQDYSGYEVIVINDRSNDRTGKIIEEFKQLPNLKFITIDKNVSAMSPKKFALAEGIRQSTGDILLFTDADCRPETNWIASMMECFDSKVGMVVGYSPIEPRNKRSIFENLIAIDSLALAAVAVGSASWGAPWTATGRSLAYRREVYDEVGGFSKIAQFVSGDDDLFLGLVRLTKWRIAYNTRGFVSTDPPRDITQFRNQKIRQASKGRHYSPKILVIALVLYFHNAMLSTYGFFQLASGNVLCLTVVSLKFTLDLALLALAAQRFGKVHFLKIYPIAAVIYPMYITVFGLWGQFGKFEWKDKLHGKKIQ